MLYQVLYTLDSRSCNARWNPLLGDEIRDHRPRNGRFGDLVIDADSEPALIERMGAFTDVIAFGVKPLSDGS